MRQGIKAALAALSLTLTAAIGLVPAKAQADDRVIIPYKQVGAWQVAVDTTLGGGCFVQAVYGKTTLLRIGFDAAHTMSYIAMADTAWTSLRAGQTYTLSVNIDGKDNPVIAIGQAGTGGTVFLRANFGSDALATLAATDAMRVWFNGRLLLAADLQGSAAAIDGLRQCQQAVATAQKGVGDPFAGVTAPAPTPAAKAPYDPFERGA